MNQTTKLFSFLIAFLGLSTVAMAATPGAYVGLGAGYSNLNTPKVDKDTTADKFDRSTGGLGGRAFIGYNLNPYFGLEGGYARYAKSSYEYLAGVDNAKVKYNLSAFDLVAKAYLPIQDTGLNVYALGGVAYAMSTADAEAWITPAPGVEPNKASNDKTNYAFLPKAGVGVGYDIPDTNLSASVEYSRIFGKGSMTTNKVLDPQAKGIPSSDLVALNLVYNFG